MSSIGLAGRRQCFRTKRRNDGYDTGHPREQLPDAGQLQPVNRTVNLVRPTAPAGARGVTACRGPDSSPAGLLRGGNQPIPNDALILAAATADSLDKPVPNAILRWLSPACQREWYFHSGCHRLTSIPKCGNDRRWEWPNDPEGLKNSQFTVLRLN